MAIVRAVSERSCNGDDQPLFRPLGQRRQGNDRTGSSRPVDEPAFTMTTRDRAAVVEPDADLDDCLSRMFEPHEVKAMVGLHRRVRPVRGHVVA
jgi:hypothetical protein